jgi:RimJ/RimL family protein N-acetyltransferase
LRYAFRKLNLHKIWDIAAASHIASIKALENAGFKIEAKLKQHFFKDGKYEDVVVVSITSEEYFMKVSETA